MSDPEYKKRFYDITSQFLKYIEIENIERKAGKTKWSFKKLFSYAIEGITSLVKFKFCFTCFCCSSVKVCSIYKRLLFSLFLSSSV